MYQLISELALEFMFKQKNLKELFDGARKMDDLNKLVSYVEKLQAKGLEAN